MLYPYQTKEGLRMRIQEAARAAGLTKKAVLYYEEAGLIHPRVEENGYRDYTSADVERLSRVAVLRRCGLSIAEIQSALDSGDLAECARRKRDALCEAGDRLSVLERMEACFPGFYGRYLRAHFGPFLRGRIETEEQQEALETVISFWDQLDIPADLQTACEAIEFPGDVEALSRGMRDIVEDLDAFFAAHQAELAVYAQYRQSDAFRQSPAYRFKAALEAILHQSGYNDIFLPAMERLSPDYAAYRQKPRDAEAHAPKRL